MKESIKVIHCSADRCSNCPDGVESICKKLCAMPKESEEPIVLAEADRGLLHLRFTGGHLTTEPPWHSEGWDSVYIGNNDELFCELGNLIDFYYVGPYLCFFMREYGNAHVKCVYRPIVRTSLEFSLLNRLSKEFRNCASSPLGTRERLTEQQKRVMKEISDYIEKHIPEINENTRTRLSQIVAHQTHTLGPLIPILLDDSTEEVYLDGPGTAAYFDHQKHGRCTTSITFCMDETPRIVTFIRAESNSHLDRSNPSLKMELDLLSTILRLSASVPPLSTSSLYLEIRRARKEPYSIQNLIENHTITHEAAAILLLAVACRLNITITGGPGTGKTSLLNALDMTTPHWWRKIYIEDALESRLSSSHHQVRLQVDSVDEQQKKLSKSEEIVKCLHRSPDYLILGEIQTAEHSQALFQSIAAGLRSIQTCHSDSASNLISRWIHGHGIDRSNLGMMDLVVTLERPKPGESFRRVKEIVEIRRGIQEGLVSYLGTNVLYDIANPNTIRWAPDGAFQTLAKSLGIKDSQKSIAVLIDRVRNGGATMDFGKLGEEMWSYGHPLRFACCESSGLH